MKLFPSPRGDELFPHPINFLGADNRFRPLAGMSCFVGEWEEIKAV